jgi:hypothetical protein
MDVIEDIGPILGIVAFLGFAILALLIVLQAREVRRLREWAGRAPERALEADEAALSASEEAAPGGAERPSRLAAFRERVHEKVGPKWDDLDRRSPFDPRLVLGGLLIGLIVAAVLTGGFGLVGDDEPAKERSGGKLQPGEIDVAVLNGTATAEGQPGVPGLAAKIGDEVKKGGYVVGPVSDAGAPVPESVVMFESGSEAPALRVAEDVKGQLGKTEVENMSSAVRELADGAPVAIVIGQDDSGI